MRILFIVRSLHLAGAERQLTVLAKGLHERGHFVGVAVLYGGGELAEELISAGVTIFEMRKKSRWDLFLPITRIFSLVRQYKFEVVHGYMTTGNILALASTIVLSPAKRVAGIRASHFSSVGLDLATRVSIAVERQLLKYFHLVICNSKKAILDFSAYLTPHTSHYVPNGIDCNKFYIDDEAGSTLRRRFAIPFDAPVLGAVMRQDPLKGADTLLQVSRIFLATFPKGYVLVVGQLAEGIHGKLRRFPEFSRFIFLGRVVNMRAAYNAMSVFLLCSTSEGFPNVIAEALACGTKCVTTNVGDAADIVMNESRIAEVGDVSTLGKQVCVSMLATDSRAQLRQSIVARYDRKSLIDTTERLLSTLLSL